jgi:hypothetical protein
MSQENQRRHERQPTDLPVKVLMEEVVASESSYLNNISEGGLSFNSMVPVPVNAVIRVRIPVNKPVFDIGGRVVWCKQSGLVYVVGVEFAAGDSAFKQRMVEVVRQIEMYRKQALASDGRNLSAQEAALEWIGKFAQDLLARASPS